MSQHGDIMWLFVAPSILEQQSPSVRVSLLYSRVHLPPDSARRPLSLLVTRTPGQGARCWTPLLSSTRSSYPH